MKISEIVTETNHTWKFKKSALTETEFSQSYHLRWRRERQTLSELKFRPAPLLASYLESVKNNTLYENDSIENLKQYQKRLLSLDQRSLVKLNPGNNISILQFVPHTSSNVIEIRGNIKSKEIKEVFYDDSSDVDWIEFTDGTTYPDREFLSHNKGGGEWDGIITLFYPNEESASLILTKILLINPDGWQVSTTNLQESSLTESASGYIPSNAEKNDPRYSSALTVDVKPNSIQKNAKKLGFKVSRSGIPPLLRK